MAAILKYQPQFRLSSISSSSIELVTLENADIAVEIASLSSLESEISEGSIGPPSTFYVFFNFDWIKISMEDRGPTLKKQARLSIKPNTAHQGTFSSSI